jgi:hypothetical protein
VSAFALVVQSPPAELMGREIECVYWWVYRAAAFKSIKSIIFIFRLDRVGFETYPIPTYTQITKI